MSANSEAFGHVVGGLVKGKWTVDSLSLGDSEEVTVWKTGDCVLCLKGAAASRLLCRRVEASS